MFFRGRVGSAEGRGGVRDRFPYAPETAMLPGMFREARRPEGAWHWSRSGAAPGDEEQGGPDDSGEKYHKFNHGAEDT